MKYIATLLSLVAAYTTAAEPPLIEIEAKYSGFDPAFFAKLHSGAKNPVPNKPPIAPRVTKSGLRDLDLASMQVAPRVTTKSGQRAVIEIIKETKVPGEVDPVGSGTILEVTPTVEGDKITLTGKSIVRRPLNSGGEQPLGAVSFTARETFFGGRIEHDKPLVIHAGDGATDKAQITLTAKLINPPLTQAK
jgi:hypothetical protein